MFGLECPSVASVSRPRPTLRGGDAGRELTYVRDARGREGTRQVRFTLSPLAQTVAAPTEALAESLANPVLAKLAQSCVTLAQ